RAPTSSLAPLSLHDALPIFADVELRSVRGEQPERTVVGGDPLERGGHGAVVLLLVRVGEQDQGIGIGLDEGLLTGTRRSTTAPRSEEHTSELQSRFDLVCRL